MILTLTSLNSYQNNKGILKLSYLGIYEFFTVVKVISGITIDYKMDHCDLAPWRLSRWQNSEV